MTYVEIQRHRRRIDAAIARAEALEPGSRLGADMAKYVCILISGYIEETIKRLVLMHCDSRAVSDPIAMYVRSQLKYFQNADVSRILQLFGGMNGAWRTQLEADLSPEECSAIDSVVHLRHQLAHGGEATTSIGSQTAYLELIERAIGRLRGLLH